MQWLAAAAVHEVRLFFIALQFLTRLPVPGWVGYREDWLRASARYFALGGAVVGVWAAVVLWAALKWFPATVSVGLCIAATVWLTGGLHEDGLADTCDGLGGAVTRERALAIMKDSRIGSYGALGLVLSLGIKAAALTALAQAGPVMAVVALVWGHAVSRASAVLLMRWLPYAGDVGQAKAPPLASRVSAGGARAVVFWVAAIGAGLVAAGALVSPRGSEITGWALSCATMAVLVVTLWCARWLRRRLGGYTGDALGATQQLAELTALLAWLSVVGSPLSAAT